jgi:Family of unknown function (DUF6232)
VTVASANFYSSKDISISPTNLEVHGQVVPMSEIHDLDASIDWANVVRQRGFLDVFLFALLVFVILGTVEASLGWGRGSGATGFLTLVFVSILIGVWIYVLNPTETHQELVGHKFRVELKDSQCLEFSVMNYQNAKEIAGALYKAKGIWAGDLELWSD